MRERVSIVEVGPRDGLQNEPAVLDVNTRLELIARLRSAGLTRIEVGAFVSPQWVPQMADTASVLSSLTPQDHTARYSVLVPNQHGWEAARAANAHAIAIFTAASEAFTQKNINCTITESLQRYEPIVAQAKAAGVSVRGYVSCVIGCPYQGPIPPQHVADVALALYHMGCDEISFGDTIGIGSPNTILKMWDTVCRHLPITVIAGHFHDTYGMAIANIYASLQFGIRTFDTSVAGLGGCPYAPGASGNVATEDVIYLLHELGFDTGVALDILIEAAYFITAKLGRTPASRVAIARKHP